MQRIGSLGNKSLTPASLEKALTKMDFFRDHWNGPSMRDNPRPVPNWHLISATGTDFRDARFRATGLLPDLANAILDYLRSGGVSTREVNRAVARVNKAFEEDLQEDFDAVRDAFNFSGKDRRGNEEVQARLDQIRAKMEADAILSLRKALASVYLEILTVVQSRAGWPMLDPLLAVRDNRVVFFPLKSAESQGVGEVSGGSNNAIMFSLVGAGLGYALAPKNRGMAAGVGAVAGYIGSTLLK